MTTSRVLGKSAGIPLIIVSQHSEEIMLELIYQSLCKLVQNCANANFCCEFTNVHSTKTNCICTENQISRATEHTTKWRKRRRSSCIHHTHTLRINRIQLVLQAPRNPTASSTQTTKPSTAQNPGTQSLGLQKPCLIAAPQELRPPKISHVCTSRSMNTIITLRKRRQRCDETRNTCSHSRPSWRDCELVPCRCSQRRQRWLCESRHHTFTNFFTFKSSYPEIQPLCLTPKVLFLSPSVGNLKTLKPHF